MSYTRGDLLTRVNAGIQGKIGMIISQQDLANEIVRTLLSEVKLRSARRKTSLVPNLYANEFQYACPADLDGISIIDIPQQARRVDGEFNLVPSAQFAVRHLLGDIAIDDFNGTRVLLIDSRVDSDSVVIDPLSQIAGVFGTWAVFGDAINLDSNSDDYIRGSASLEFDINGSGGTMAGIKSTGTTLHIDLSGYIAHAAAIFVNARITSITGLTNYKLRLGTNSTNYYEFTVTLRNDGTAFAAGWNLLRFDMLSYTTTGSPDSTDVSYVNLFMTKTTGKINEAGYMFNYLVAKKGKYADVKYYSKFGWQDAITNAYKELSTSDNDILVCDTDEFELFVNKGRAMAAREVDLSANDVERRDNDYASVKANYMMRNPSEEKTTISSYHNYDDCDRGIEDGWPRW